MFAQKAKPWTCVCFRCFRKIKQILATVNTIYSLQQRYVVVDFLNTSVILKFVLTSTFVYVSVDEKCDQTVRKKYIFKQSRSVDLLSYQCV